MVTDKFTGAPRGFCFAEFATIADAAKVLHTFNVSCAEHMLCSLCRNLCNLCAQGIVKVSTCHTFKQASRAAACTMEFLRCTIVCCSCASMAASAFAQRHFGWSFIAGLVHTARQTAT